VRKKSALSTCKIDTIFPSIFPVLLDELPENPGVTNLMPKGVQPGNFFHQFLYFPFPQPRGPGSQFLRTQTSSNFFPKLYGKRGHLPSIFRRPSVTFPGAATLSLGKKLGLSPRKFPPDFRVTPEFWLT
jgi:hypothetical protein